MNKVLINEIINMVPDETSVSDVGEIYICDKTYRFSKEKELETIYEGKYQSGASVYALYEYNEEDDETIGEPLFYVLQDFVQVGDYYSFQEFYYEKPYQVKEVEKVIKVWERVEEDTNE